jgi:hypothetical protein
VSFSFYTTAYGPPPLAHLLTSADDHGDLQVAEELVDPWLEGYAFHLHRDQLSTRGVELCWESDQLQVRLLTLSSPEDWELAFRVLEEATGGRGTIRAEDGREESVEDLRRVFGDLCSTTNEGGTRFLIERIEEGETNLTLPGPIRPFCIGPRVLEELLSEGPREGLTERLLDRIRNVQYTREAEHYYAASVLQAASGEEVKFTLAAFGPGVRYLLPEVQFVALVSDDDQELFLDYDSLLVLLSSWCRYLDERQVFVEALEGQNWTLFLEVARSCGVDPIALLGGRVDHDAHRERVEAGALELAARLRPGLGPTPSSRRAELNRTVELLKSAREREPEALGVWADLAAALGQRARLLSREGDPEGAIRDQEQSIRVLAKLARRDPEARSDLALAYARRSDLAAAQGLPRDALADLERAASILARLEEPREARLNLVACRCRQAELRAALGETSEVDKHLHDAEAIAETTDEDGARVRILRTRARIFPESSATYLEAALGLAEGLARRDPTEVEEAFEVASELWEGQLLRLEVAAAEQTNVRALALLEDELDAQRASPSWIGRILSARAALLGAQLRRAEALEVAERAGRLLQELGASSLEVARAWDGIASAREDASDLSGAVAAYDEALACGEGSEHGLQGLERARAHVLRATILIEHGEPDAAEADLAAARSVLEPGARAPSQRWLLAGVLHAEARQATLAGRLEEAQVAAARAVAVLELLQDGDPMSEGFLAIVRVVLGECHLALGQDDAASDSIAASLRVLERHAAAGLRLGEPTQGTALRIQAELERRRGRPAESLALAERGLQGSVGLPHRRAALLAARGRALWDLESRADARAAFEEARQILLSPFRPLELCSELELELALARDEAVQDEELAARVRAGIDALEERLQDAPAGSARAQALARLQAAWNEADLSLRGESA